MAAVPHQPEFIKLGQNCVLKIAHISTKRAFPDSSMMTTKEGCQVGNYHEIGVDDADLNTLQCDETQKQSNSNYGSIKITEVDNFTTNIPITYVNPDQGKEGVINPGASEKNYCVGYIPLWSYGHTYDIKYNDGKFMIKDLDGDWKISVYEEGVGETIVSLPPSWWAFTSYISLELWDF